MKSVLAVIILLSSNLCFADAASDAAAQEQAASTLVISCAIEKLCAPNSSTPFDQSITSGKAQASAVLGGMDCSTPEIAAIFVDPTFNDDLKALTDAVAANGATTCLAAAVVTTPAN